MSVAGLTQIPVYRETLITLAGVCTRVPLMAGVDLPNDSSLEFPAGRSEIYLITRRWPGRATKSSRQPWNLSASVFRMGLLHGFIRNLDTQKKREREREQM